MIDLEDPPVLAEKEASQNPIRPTCTSENNIQLPGRVTSGAKGIFLYTLFKEAS